MKHNKVIAAVATAASLLAVSNAQAFAPAVAAGIGALIGAGTGAAHNQNEQAQRELAARQAQQAPALAVVPGDSTVVLGGPPAQIHEAIPAPRDGYRWEQGHFEMRDGVSTWVTGHWLAQ